MKLTKGLSFLLALVATADTTPGLRARDSENQKRRSNNDRGHSISSQHLKQESPLSKSERTGDAAMSTESSTAGTKNGASDSEVLGQEHRASWANNTEIGKKENEGSNVMQQQQQRRLDLGQDMGDGAVSLLDDAALLVLGDAVPFKTCDAPNQQRGVVPDGFLDPLSGCYNSLAGPVQVLRRMIEALTGPLGDEPIVKELLDLVFAPVEEVMKELSSLIPATGTICAGDFSVMKVTAPKGDMVGTCEGMPLSSANKGEWAIFGGELVLSPEVSTAVCQITTTLEFSFCMGVSVCDILPSVAFFMDGGLMTCILNYIGKGLQTITAGGGAAAATGVGAVVAGVAGAAAVVIEYVKWAIAVGFEHAGFGFSLSNAFEIPMALFNGEKLFHYVARPTTFEKISISVQSGTIHPQLKDWFQIDGDVIHGTTMLMPNGEPVSTQLFDKGLADFDRALKNHVEKQFDNFQVHNVFQGKCRLALNFRNIPVIGALFPQFDFEFGRASVFTSTGSAPVILQDGSQQKVYPGMSAFIGQTGNEGALFDAVKKLVLSMGGIIDQVIDEHFPIANLLGENLATSVVEMILGKMDLDRVASDNSNKYYGIAVTMNVEYVGFMVQVPMLLGESLDDPITDFILKCGSDYETFGCEITMDNMNAFIAAVAEEVAGGLLWVFQKTAEFLKLDEAAEIIGTAFEKAGEQIKDVFSKDNIEDTIKDIVDGKLDVDEKFQELASIGYAAFSALCKDAERCKPDGEACFGDPLGLKPKQGTCCDCCHDDTFWAGPTKPLSLPGRACGTEPWWKDGRMCIPGISCHMCQNGDNQWDSVPDLLGLPGRACGQEPCTPDGMACFGPSCKRCCSGTNMFAKCGKQGCLGDGTVCLIGTTCFDCCNGDSWWWSKGLGSQACGTEPKWGDGQPCVKGISCHMCSSGHSTYWMNPPGSFLPAEACGKEPCWPDGKNCVNGISCHQCCSKNNMEFKCGKQGCWGDGRPCLFGGCKNCCSHENSWWDDKVANACGKQPCWGGGRECGLACGRCCGGSHERKQGFWDLFPKRYCN
ncbi:expressed unknown protein [Seminavis robusta]|uniref:Uncharacterized protein n=1 Tax=Seminavis robusta TaxID=568900 RepID=A0A9N8EF81_9STRA|nr:expressed unknown protein [Seminavis robusta]|eukprot:Sro857_g211670.1 n/a (1047) ;mRNA; r:13045-17391